MPRTIEPMRVTLTDTAHFGPSCTVMEAVSLRDCFPEDTDYQQAEAALVATGEYRCGGGAAPSILVTYAPQSCAVCGESESASPAWSGCHKYGPVGHPFTYGKEAPTSKD